MTEEERKLMIDYLEDMKEEYVEGEGNEKYPLPEWYMLDKVIKIIQQQPSENEELIKVSKGAVKARTGRFVVYDVKWLKEHFNTTEAKIYGQPSEDCISRKAVLDALHNKFANGFDSDKWWNSTHVLNAINKVPSIAPQPKEEPQQKTGHWIGHREHCEKLGVIPSGLGVYEWCSNCGHGIDIRDWSRISHNYCPNCGAKMQEVKK